MKDRAFGSFFVLLGAGIVGTIFGLVSFKIMEEQEQLMNQRLSSLASKFHEIMEKRKIKKLKKEYDIKRNHGDDSNSNNDDDSGRNNNNNNNNNNDSSNRNLESNKTCHTGSIQHFDIEEKNEKLSSFKSIKKSVKKTVADIFRLKSKTITEYNEMSDMNLAIYEDEILDIKVGAILNVLLFFITLFSGALAMSALENWNFTDSVYWVRDLIIFFSSILFYLILSYFILFFLFFSYYNR